MGCSLRRLLPLSSLSVKHHLQEQVREEGKFKSLVKGHLLSHFPLGEFSVSVHSCA
jgi:hypothetical protein